ncbi:MAG: CHASE2 domain-containing protein [Muribaculaceae bacterium]|nr:CHASE2 domain-containing protein [Muribaculaceae bacterium]
MTDLFFQIADNRPVRTLEDRIAILDIGNLNRLEIADLLEVLSLCEPKAVAIDVNFETTTENDSLLLNALSHLPALVLPLGAEQEGDRFTVTDHPFFYGDFPYAQYGIVNLPTSFKGATVRNYAVSFPMTDGATMLSFPEAAAKAAGFPTDSGTKDNGSVPTGIIAYHSKEIPIIAHNELADNIEQLHDKIVLVGTTSEAGDVYATPLRRGVSGMLIHAYALSSILDGSRLTRMPAIIGDLTAVAICYVMVLAAIGIKSGIRGLLIRLGQITALYFLVWAGYSMLVDHEIVGDFSQAILMVAFGLFSVDLWNGTDALIKWIRKKVHGRRSMQLNS